MSDIKILTKIIGKRDIQKSLQQIETELNNLKDSVNFMSEDTVHDYKGKSGDIRISKNATGDYSLEGRTQEGWKRLYVHIGSSQKNKAEIFFKDKPKHEAKVSSVSILNYQYAHFGINSNDSMWSGTVADYHYAVPFNSCSLSGLVHLGNAADPGTAYTLSGATDNIQVCIWYIVDAIKIDSVIWWNAATAASGDTVRAHLMSYSIDKSNSATSGDLSDGKVIAYSADIANDGTEQSYYNKMILEKGNQEIGSGKVVMFCFRQDGVNSDYAINATVKYHLQ